MICAAVCVYGLGVGANGLGAAGLARANKKGAAGFPAAPNFRQKPE